MVKLNIILPISLTLLSIIGTFLATMFGVNYKKKKEEKNKPKILPLGTERTNKDFYKEFESLIKNAETDIWITGRGLRMDGPDRQIALDYIHSFKSALEKQSNLNIVRIQYGENADKEWYKEFKQLKIQYGKRIAFYVLGDTTNYDTVHVAAIDPDSTVKSVAEIMVPAIKHEGIEKKEIAGSAIIIKGNQEISMNIRDRIYKNCELAENLDTPEKFDELISKS